MPGLSHSFSLRLVRLALFPLLAALAFAMPTFAANASTRSAERATTVSPSDPSAWSSPTEVSLGVYTDWVTVTGQTTALVAGTISGATTGGYVKAV